MCKKFFMALIILTCGATAHIFAAPGDLDVTFNPAGVQPGTKSTAIDNTVRNCSGHSAVIQTNGKIVVAGDAEIGGIFKFAVARFNTDGSLDTTFNPAGVQPGTKSTAIDNTVENCSGPSAVIQTDGKIVVAGYARIGGVYKFAVARFNTDGSLDVTFNPAGVQPGTKSTTIDNAVGNCSGESVAMQADGKIVVAGYALIGLVNKFAVARFNTDGSLDTTFNPLGVQPGTKSTAIDNTAGDCYGYSAAMQTDGKIVVAGNANISGFYKFAVARFNTDGSLDTTFNPTGVQPGTKSTAIDNTAGTCFGQSVAIQANGKIVVAGSARIGGVYKFAVARFNTDGDLDTTFNPTGVQPGTKSTEIDNTTLHCNGLSVAIQANGKIVVAGDASFVGGANKFAVARFNSDGNLDTTFNFSGAQPGTKSTAIDNTAENCSGYSAVIQTDGKIVVSGEASIDDISKIGVARFEGDLVVKPTPTTDPYALRLIAKYGLRL